jgi:hypothetical protein
MQAIVSLLLGCLLLTTMACGGGVDSIPTAPGPNPPPTAPPPAPSVPIIAISVGEVIHATVGIQDSVCDPTGWDATAPCKRFSIVATQDGTLHAILRPTPPLVADDVIDLLLSCSNGGGDYSGGGLEQRVSAAILKGQSCFITVNMYGYLRGGPGTLAFELRTEL